MKRTRSSRVMANEVCPMKALGGFPMGLSQGRKVLAGLPELLADGPGAWGTKVDGNSTRGCKYVPRRKG